MTTTVSRPASDPANSAELEPRIGELLAAKRLRCQTYPYTPRTVEDVAAGVSALMHASGVQDFVVTDVQRMAGGASKEQFCFSMRIGEGEPQRQVLRQDPRESIVETCRYREAELFRVLAGTVPVPTVCFLDGDGTYLGQPGIVTNFIVGVNKPPDNANNVSGVGTAFSEQWRARLTPQFVDCLVKIHDFDWRAADLPHFRAPAAHPTQAALWQLNWWSRAWRDDCVDPVPLMTLAERWLRQRLPEIDVESRDVVLVHGDYRPSNFLFDAESGVFTAVLDWELAHLGDFHEDLGYIVQRLFAGAAENGHVLACNLLTRAELLDRYQVATGRTVDPGRLRFYEMLAAYKLTVITMGTGYAAAKRGNNHQDVMLAWLTSLGHTFLAEIARMIEQES